MYALIASVAGISWVVVTMTPESILVEHLKQYLQRYAQEIRTVVADETYVQEVPTGSAGGAYRVPSVGVRQRQIHSNIVMAGQSALLSWLGVRIINTVDGQELKGSADRIRKILESHDADSWTRARELSAESANMNLGDDRNINLPTLPLQLLDGSNSSRFKYRAIGAKKIGHAQGAGRAFSETSKPTIIRSLQGECAVHPS
jgi:hypothetical protein